MHKASTAFLDTLVDNPVKRVLEMNLRAHNDNNNMVDLPKVSKSWVVSLTSNIAINTLRDPALVYRILPLK